MATFLFMKPYDHFSGSQRLLVELKQCLQSPTLSSFNLAVAFAKAAPISKLLPDLEMWRKAKKTSRAIIGLNHKGTSVEALTLALNLFDETFVCYPGSAATFHPKIYLFEGPELAIGYFGSHNLTVGGTETNFEAGIKFQLSLPEDAPLLSDARSAWESLLPAKCKATLRLDAALLAKLSSAGMLFDEASPGERFATPKKPPASAGSGASLFPTIWPKPPIAVPKAAFGKSPKKAPPPKPAKPSPPMPTVAAAVGGDSLAIEIVPHHNGEVFLSKNAINQNPKFFGFPFTGLTTPKKASNKAYPQRDPDPIVNVVVFDGKGSVVLQKTGFPLNTVFYAKKGEIRITFSPDLLNSTKPFSVMHMRAGDGSCDYYLDIHNPGSQQHAALLDACNQVLPSGGGKSRKMGWL